MHSREPQGLRERKKARTRASIQSHALRLFSQHGYANTAMSQIAEAAEVSESTLYRYFPTKEDLVLWDDFDPVIIDAFRAQPPGPGPLEALRAAFRVAYAELTPEQWASQQDRLNLIWSEPELRAAMLTQFADTVQLVAELVAERLGRQPDEFAVRSLAGAVIGMFMAVMLTAAEDPTADWVQLTDDAFAHLEAGLPV